MRITRNHYIKGTEPCRGVHPGLPMRKAWRYSRVYTISFPKGWPRHPGTGAERCRENKLPALTSFTHLLCASAFSAYKVEAPEKPSVYLRAQAAKVRLTRGWGRPGSSQGLLSSHSLIGQVSFLAHPTREDFKCVRIGYKVIPAKPADQARRCRLCLKSSLRS